MAEVVGIVASAFTLASAAHGAAQLAQALFKVTSTFKNAREEMAGIAQGLSQFSTSLQSLDEILNSNKRYRQVADELAKLLETPSNLRRFLWTIKKPKAKNLLRKIEGIKNALSMELSILQLAVLVRGQVNHTLVNAPIIDPTASQRKVTETVVQANRQVVESAQHEDIEDTVLFSHLDGKRTELDLRRQYSFDTATWLYQLVFGPSILESLEEPSHQPSVSDDNDSDKHDRTVALPSASREPLPSPNKQMIIWNARTEPNKVVDRLLSTWTTLSVEQIAASSAHKEDDKWARWAYIVSKTIKEAKEEEESAEKNDTDTDEESVTDAQAEDSDQSATSKKRRVRETEPTKHTRRATQANSTQASLPRHVTFEHPTEMPPKYTNKAGTASENPSRRNSTLSHNSVPTVSERFTERSKRSTKSIPSSNHVQHPLQQAPATFVPSVRNAHPFTNPPYQSQYAMNRPGMPRYDASSGWSPYSHMSPVYPLPIHLPPSAPEVPTQRHATPLSQDQTGALTEETIRTVVASVIQEQDNKQSTVADNRRLLRIESLLAAQQDNLARIERARAEADNGADVKQMSTISNEYNKIIESLEQLRVQQEEERHREKADACAEKDNLGVSNERYDTIVRALEQHIAQQREERHNAEETWRSELKILKDQAERAVEAREIALQDTAAAQSVAEAAQKSLDTAKAEIEAERILVEKRNIATAEARRKADEDYSKHFQRYEKLLKASQEAPRKLEPVVHQPVRQTRMMDKHRSIEVNEYLSGASGSSSALPFSPLKFFQNDTRRPETNVQYYETSSWPSRERHSSFHGSSASFQSPGLFVGSGDRLGSSQGSQQMVLFPSKVDRNSISTSKLQSYLKRSGFQAIFGDRQELTQGELVSFEEGNTQVVRSTLFWEPPARALGSELLLTMKTLGWKPSYSRKSTTGRTYFLGDQPVHSYFFQPHYIPQFSPPTCPNPQDTIIIDGALIEEYALMELKFNFRKMTIAEYELDGWLTFDDIDGLIERSFMLRENRYRSHYRQPPAVQWFGQPTTPGTQTTFEQHHAPSTASASSKVSRRSRASTEVGQSEDEGFETSQTSQPDVDGSNSVWNGDRGAVSIDSWVEKTTTNPFRGRTQDGQTKPKTNPWAQEDIWGGPSLI